MCSTDNIMVWVRPKNRRPQTEWAVASRIIKCTIYCGSYQLMYYISTLLWEFKSCRLVDTGHYLLIKSSLVRFPDFPYGMYWLTAFSKSKWAGRGQDYLSLGWETILEGGLTTIWPTAWRCVKKTGILPHYYFPWNDLKFYIKKEEDKWTP